MDNDKLFEEAVEPDEVPEVPEEKPEEKPEQTAQERSRQAEGRRIREREARAYKAARDDMSATLKRLGITNPETGEEFQSVDELEAYEKAMSDQRLESGSANADDLRRIVREEMQATHQTSPDDKAMVDQQLAEIRAMDPEMRDLNAILNSEAGPRFREYVERGLDFVESYTLAAKDRLAEINSNRARRSTGKEHLSATTQRGSGALEVPADEMAIFRVMMPDASEADIQKYYNADRKRFAHN